MAFPGSVYAPPGVYTQTNSESPLQGLAAAVRIPLLMGTGSEILLQDALEVVRGSSSSVDQEVPEEDLTGRAVSAISLAGEVTLAAFDGVLDRVQVHNFPIVDGEGSGTTVTNSNSINVTINGLPVVVLGVNGAKGILQLSVAPKSTDVVRATYFFNRKDTRTTDTVSDQVSSLSAQIWGQVGENFIVTEGVNDQLNLLVDNQHLVSATISASPPAGWTAGQLVAFVNAAAAGTTLVASATINNFGNTVVLLEADGNLSVLSGSANTVLGLTTGQKTIRNQVFYTFQRPIVDGSNGGVASTDPSNVVVKVNGIQVIPTALDGHSGAITLPVAPPVGSTVTVQYWFNTWQGTFDYLRHRNLTQVVRAGLTPNRSDYVQGVDFVLEDDRIVWGAAALLSSGAHTAGSTRLGEVQITPVLVDARQYLAECLPVTDTTVNPPRDSRKNFELPLQATTGNGRNSPLGTAGFNEAANGRIDLPTNRPDLVFAYWGFSLSDAVNRGRVQVTKVDSSTSTITLAQPVPVGARVWATFYYNTLQDAAFQIVSASEGGSGVGTYVVTRDGEQLLGARISGKSAALSTISIEFPSGSESLPDLRFETPFETGSFQGPVLEDVTVTFATQAATLGVYTLPGASPYYVVTNASDNFDLVIDGGALVGGHVNLSDPSGFGSGFVATLVGDVVSYSEGTGGATYAIDSTNNSVEFVIDGVLVQAQANSSGTGTVASYVTALNRAAFGDFGAATAGGASSITLAAGASDIDSYYVGWTLKVTAGPAAGDSRTVSAYNGSTRVATVSAPFSGTPVATNTYYVFDPDTVPMVRSATRFLSPVVITAGEYDELELSYTGSVTGQTTISCSGVDAIAAGTYTSAALLAAAVQTAVNSAISTASIECEIKVASDSSGRLTFTLSPDPTDLNGGFLEFVATTPATDFAVLAGLDADVAAQGSQLKLVNSWVARRFTFGSAPLQNDRLIVRSRLVPGNGTLSGEDSLAQTELRCLGGTGAAQAGLSVASSASAGLQAVMKPPTAMGRVGFSGGQVPTGTYSTAADGQPLVTFYGAGGTNPQNNVLNLVAEGTPVTVVFKTAAGAAIASGASADVPLGPKAGVAQTTILSQIAAALQAAGVSTTVVQEGAGIRFVGASSAANSTLVIGNGSANEVLGLAAGDSFGRTELDASVLASGLMSHTAGTLGAALLTGWVAGGAATYFSGEALATVVASSSNARYLQVQSLGTAGAGTLSSVAIAVASTDSVTRPGTGFGVIGGEGNSGEDAVDGFFVTSSDPVSGSGSANSSWLNSGSGQDGNVGQTYRDSVTGLTFSILPREGGGSYPAGSTITLQVRAEHLTDSNLPTMVVPGVELLVSNTLGVPAGDSAVLNTYVPGGAEPAVGDLYYVSYLYQKASFATQLYTKLSTIQAAYGDLSTSNPLVLASYLAITNGAVLLAMYQVQKDVDGDGDGVFDSASTEAFFSAVDKVAGTLPGGSTPDYLVPLKGDSLTFFQYLGQHCDIQSSIRYRAERTAIVGLAAGTMPETAGSWFQAINNTRVRVKYPDIYTMSLTNAQGRTESFLVDGTYMAAAWAGNRASPTRDVATPWTNSFVFGFDSVARTLDPVQANSVAVRGGSVMVQDGSRIKCRHGLTTDMGSILTKLPTVTTIADEVQRTSRQELDVFVGTKFLPGVTGQIEARLKNNFKRLQSDQIVAKSTGISATTPESDPTVAEVEAYYAPVFPLLYIILSFNVRASL